MNRKPLLAALVVVFIAVGWWQVDSLRRLIIESLGNPWKVEAAPGSPLGPTFRGPDAERERLAVTLEQVAEGAKKPTDVQFVPGDPQLMVVLGKKGQAWWFDLAAGTQGELLSIEVRTASEEGLLGLAFAPDFQESGLFYLNYVISNGGADFSVVAEWSVPPGSDLRAVKPTEVRKVMAVEQPYQNHDAGQLAFGPDGLLYVGWGDGGYRYDPHGHGQDTSTLLGSMLRIDPKADGERGYTIPADNPFVDDPDFRPEIWAVGLRNPWRYSFAPDGRLIVADVGQDKFEEVSVLGKGDNLGWNVREARHCFEPAEGCAQDGLVEPFYEYGRADGQSITGGFVYTGAEVPALKDLYVFGDFVSGRIWAIPLPQGNGSDAPLVEAKTTGKWNILLSSFGQDASGELYVADFQGGGVYKLAPAAAAGG